MAVSIRNVYYLLCYALDYLEARDLVDVNAIPGDRVENLLGQVLRDGVSQLVRRGLDRGYVGAVEDGRRLRGKVLVSETVQRILLPQGRVACQVDDLSYDVPHNRVLKAAMTALMGIPSLDDGIRRGLRDHCLLMREVSDVDLSPATFRTVQLHRNIARYRFLLDVCRLVDRSFLPEPGTGRRRFRPFTSSDQEMGALFEEFVRNFLKREQDAFKVGITKVPWEAVSVSGSDLAWLPEMRTDVLLTSPTQRIVIETKYTGTPNQARYGGVRKLISSHLYQLSTYLAHLTVTSGPRPIGMLLYAGNHEDQHLEYRLGGHTILIRSLDLALEWREIHQRLLGLSAELESRAPVSGREAGSLVEEPRDDASAL